MYGGQRKTANAGMSENFVMQSSIDLPNAPSVSGINIFHRALKVIARSNVEALLELALPGQRVEPVGTLETVELSLAVRPVDFVQRVRHEDEEKLVHMEFQLEHRDEFPVRMCEYHGGLSQQFRLPVLSFAIYLRRREKPIPNVYATRVGDVVVNRFEYPVIKLWEHAASIERGDLPGLAPLLVMLVQEPTEQTLRRERELILSTQAQPVRGELLSTALTLAARYFDKEFLLRFFREEMEMIKGSSIIEEWIREGMERGREEGLEEGLERGRGEAVLSILRKRFSPTADDLLDLAQQLEEIDDLSTLAAAVEAALDSHTLADFQRWLAEHNDSHPTPAR